MNNHIKEKKLQKRKLKKQEVYKNKGFPANLRKIKSKELHFIAKTLAMLFLFLFRNVFRVPEDFIFHFFMQKFFDRVKETFVA